MSISDIVNVQITREAAPVSNVGFGTLLILGVHKKFNERIKYYQTVAELSEDGFTEADPEYVAARLALSQEIRPTMIAIGRRSVDSVDLTIANATPDLEYSVTINGEVFSYVADAEDAEEDIALELVTLINADTELNVTATNNANGTFTLDADEADVPYTLKSSKDVEINPLAASGLIEEDLSAIESENDDFYGIMITEREDALAHSVAAWTESRIKIFGYASSDEDIYDINSDSDIASVFNDLNYHRSFVLYHSEAHLLPEAGIMGLQLARVPGSSTWAFKTITGVPSSSVSSNRRIVIYSKKANTYETRNRKNIFYEGTMASGRYIDDTRGIDWFQVGTQERVFNLLSTTPKVPYTDQGINQIETEIKAQLDLAVAVGLFAADPAPTVTVPLVSSISPIDKGNRHLPNIAFNAMLAGAIHRVSIVGVVTI